jgi:hypothetical protein
MCFGLFRISILSNAGDLLQSLSFLTMLWILDIMKKDYKQSLEVQTC